MGIGTLGQRSSSPMPSSTMMAGLGTFARISNFSFHLRARSNASTSAKQNSLKPFSATPRTDAGCLSILRVRLDVPGDAGRCPAHRHTLLSIQNAQNDQKRSKENQMNRNRV